jgi:hypothetical protein
MFSVEWVQVTGAAPGLVGFEWIECQASSAVVAWSWSSLGRSTHQHSRLVLLLTSSNPSHFESKQIHFVPVRVGLSVAWAGD